MNRLVGRRGMMVGAGAALSTGLGRRARGQQASDELTLFIASGALELGTSTLTSLPEMLGLLGQERLDLKVRAITGSAMLGQMVAAGQGDVAHAGTSVALLLPNARGANLAGWYHMINHNFQMPAVPVDSPITTLADLKGKRIGVPGQATATLPIVRSVLRSAGLNPDVDVRFIDVGYGAQAAAALWVSKQVEALAMYDSVYAGIENVDLTKYKLRVLNSEAGEKVSFQTALISKAAQLTTRKRDALVKLGRIQAKTTIFATENPAAAVQLHYNKFPEQRPANMPAAEALAAGTNQLLSRLRNMRIDDRPANKGRWGYTDRADVAYYMDLLEKGGSLPSGLDPDKQYTNELIDEINDFDQEAWRKQARAFTV